MAWQQLWSTHRISNGRIYVVGGRANDGGVWYSTRAFCDQHHVRQYHAHALRCRDGTVCPVNKHPRAV